MVVKTQAKKNSGRFSSDAPDDIIITEDSEKENEK
jgi:hypothetical protein